MSFSSTTKNELCRMVPEEPCCQLGEIRAFLYLSGNMKQTDSGLLLRVSTENAAIARRLYSLLKSFLTIGLSISVRKSKTFRAHNIYILTVSNSNAVNIILDKTGLTSDGKGSLLPNNTADRIVLAKECCQRAFLRGAFLAAGSISDPEKTYHLEITTHYQQTARFVRSVINRFKLNAKVIRRKNSFVVYLKEGEHIIDFLNIIGAHNALMNLENIRILKEMRNNVNRSVNCETANLEKIVSASVRQIENIRFISEHFGLDRLPDNLKEIALLREKYSDASLKELGQMLSPPVGKSGVNHRLRKLDEFAEEMRNPKGESFNG